jgi:hypothetical protein
MNLEEMLQHEREGVLPNPLIDRTDEIITRVRRRRRTRIVLGSVASGAALAVSAVVAGQLVAPQAPPTTEAGTAAVSAPLLRDHPGPLEPGPYVASVVDAPSAPVLPVLTVPAGYSGIDGGVGVITGDPNQVEEKDRYLWVWNIDLVSTHPCDALGYAADPGPTVADLANALASQPMRQGSDPAPVSIGGYQGLYVELTMPQDLDISDCAGGVFRSWPGRVQDYGAGQVDMVWVLDVDGQRITFDAAYPASASPAQVQELKDIVTKATFVTMGPSQKHG